MAKGRRKQVRGGRIFSGREAAQFLQKQFTALGKYLIFFPCDVEMGDEPRNERAEDEIALFRLDDLIEADGVTHPLPHEQTGVVEQVICSHDVELALLLLKPFGDDALSEGMLRADERLIPEILGR